MSEALDVTAVAERIRQQQAAAIEAERAKTADKWTFIRPLDVAATNYVKQVQDDERVYLGITPIDELTRGHSRGELVFISGRPFSGKTQLMLSAVNHNSGLHGIIFTPDESAEAVLAKLIAIRYGISSEQLEQRVAAHDVETLKLIHHVAAVDFNKLIVIDAGLTLAEMGRALEEAEQHWQAPADFAVYDYLDLLPGESGFTGTTTKSQAMKGWAKLGNLPVFCLHQAKKGDTNRGESPGIDGMRFGGEDAATAVMLVYRKRDNTKLSEYDRQGHKNTVTVDVAKNKRPPMRTGERDLWMDPLTGHIRPATRDDMLRDGAPTKSAAEMLRSGGQK